MSTTVSSCHVYVVDDLPTALFASLANWEQHVELSLSALSLSDAEFLIMDAYQRRDLSISTGITIYVWLHDHFHMQEVCEVLRYDDLAKADMHIGDFLLIIDMQQKDSLSSLFDAAFGGEVVTPTNTTFCCLQITGKGINEEPREITEAAEVTI